MRRECGVCPWHTQAALFDRPKEAAYIPRVLAVSARGRQWRFATRGGCLALSRRRLSVPGRPGSEEGAVPHQDQQQREDAMTKRLESKYKLDRRMGQNIWGRPKSPVNRREYGPGQHGQRRKGKLSDFGVQLKAKQKLRGYYGNISEKQFRGIYDEAIRMKGDSGAHMIGLLERRLDAIVFRAKFAPTPFAARQLINHGHIKVNGRRVNIPSYRVKVGDTIEVKEKSKQMNLVLEAQALAERDVPDYIDVDGSKMTAKFVRIPALTDVPYAVQMEPHLVVEFYSR
jgi:small subunit ribosomal protein S4